MLCEVLEFDERVDRELVLNSPLFINWMKRVSDFNILKCRVESCDRWGNGHVGFIELNVTYEVDGYVSTERFILSGTSVIIVCIINDVYTVLVEQPRIACGKLSLEFPAGMCDDSTDLRGVAVRELEEESGIVVSPQDLIELGSYYISPYKFDELETVFLCRTEMTEDAMRKLEGKMCGVDEEEQITVKLVKFSDVPALAKEASTLGATYLTQKFLSEKVFTLHNA